MVRLGLALLLLSSMAQAAVPLVHCDGCALAKLKQFKQHKPQAEQALVLDLQQPLLAHYRFAAQDHGIGQLSTKVAQPLPAKLRVSFKQAIQSRQQLQRQLKQLTKNGAIATSTLRNPPQDVFTLISDSRARQRLCQQLASQLPSYASAQVDWQLLQQQGRAYHQDLQLPLNLLTQGMELRVRFNDNSWAQLELTPANNSCAVFTAMDQQFNEIPMPGAMLGGVYDIKNGPHWQQWRRYIDHHWQAKLVERSNVAQPQQMRCKRRSKPKWQCDYQ
ncbi:hypothetical protein [uncultured Ferrimonas sp.]|uniref:hypothetical protein n=1 Tax=uncultured Ferrimonas sp. TaxID=432640 RepID=UPI002637C904|nr:hypothetical protein [uncultured Ferrimonas sp.]